MKTGKSEKSGLLSMTWPIVVELLITGFMANVNQVILNAFSSNALAVTGSTSQVLVVLLNMYGIVSIGTSIILAPVVGAKRYCECNKIITTAILVNLIFGMILSAGGILLIPWMLDIINIPAELYDMGKQYLLISVGFSFVQALIITLNAIFRSLGEMKKVTATMVGLNFIYLVLNFLTFKLVPKSAQSLMLYTINAIIAQFLGVVMFVIMLFRNKKLNYKVSVHELFHNTGIFISQILHYGIPGGFEGLIYLVSQTIVVSFVGILGTRAMMTKAYVGNITYYMSMSTTAIAAGSAVIIGHMIGEGQVKKINATSKKVIQISLVITVSVCVLLMLVSRNFLRIYTQDEFMIRVAIKILVINSMIEIVRCVTGNMVGMLKAVGDVYFPFVLVILGSILNISISYYFGIYCKMGLVGIWFGYLGDLFVRGIVSWIRFKRGKWIKDLVFIKSTES